MSTHDRVAYRQTHSHTFSLCCEEGSKNTSEMGRIQTRAVIRHGDDNISVTAGPRLEAQRPLAVVGFTHRLDGIHHQVQHHLLHLNPVSLNKRKVGGEL